MSTTVLNGTDVCLFIGTDTKKVIAMSDSCKISMTLATIKTSNKDSGSFETSVGSRFSWSIDSSQFEAVGTDADRLLFDDLMVLFLAKTPITVTMGAVTGAFPQVLGTGKNLSGTAIITKLDKDAKDASGVTNAITLEGTGALTNAVATGVVPSAPVCRTIAGTIVVSSPLGAGLTYSIDGVTYTNTTGIFVDVVAGDYSVTAKNATGTSAGTSVTVV
jgi:predicted secreted protein